MDKYILIFSIIILIIADLCVIYSVFYRYKKYRNKYLESLNNKNITTNTPNTQQRQNMTIPLYNDLVKIFKELIQHVATIEEINILIEQKAEVTANLIQNTDLDYVSFDNLLIWKESFLRQLDLYFIFARDVFNSVSYLLDINSKQEFIKQLGYVGNFIDIEKEKENNNDKI